MANTLPKWTNERVTQLEGLVTDGEVVSTEQVQSISETMETTTRSIASKLRKMGYEVASAAKNSVFTDEQSTELTKILEGNPGAYNYAELAEQFADGAFSPKQIQGKVLHLRLTDNVKATVKAEATHTFSEDETAELTSFVEANEGDYTYAEIAAAVCGGKFSNRQVQGKLLSLELTGSVKATPKAVAVKTYTDEEEATVIAMANEGKFLEEIAETVSKPINSVRGKALSLLTKELITSIPKQRDSNAASKADLLEGVDVEGSTVEEIATAISRTETGVKSLLTRRGLTCTDYDGAAKAAKRAEKEDAKED